MVETKLQSPDHIKNIYTPDSHLNPKAKAALFLISCLTILLHLDTNPYFYLGALG